MRLLLAAALLFVSGCGFHLAGHTPLPPGWTPLTLDGDNRYNELIRAVRDELSFNGVELGSGGARLVVRELERDYRDAALDNRARVSQIMILREVQVSLRDADGNVIAGPKTLLHRRVFDNDPDSPVSEGSERAEAERADSRELAVQVRRQVERWARQSRD